MPRLPVISGRDCVRALRGLGFEVSHQKGSHVTMSHSVDPARHTDLPLHPELDRGSLSAILRQAEISRAEFLEALDG